MSLQLIHKKIFEIREQKVMLDFDLAELYEVETRVLNQSVKRNIDKFPEDFMFRLTAIEWENIRQQTNAAAKSSSSAQIAAGAETETLTSQIVISKKEKRGGTQKMPYAFTEHGVTMVASVLRSKRAIDMNIAIVRAFIAIRHFVNKNKDLAEQIHELRTELQTRIGEHDVQLASIYDALENLLDKKEDEQEKAQQWKERQRIGFKK